ncbi:MAG: 3-isopropylmalate dehydratase large subunit [Desulfarculaceae bacterium]|nr:3-isopropylmalate dehydratase large subunit [Desulfarculaceae bacterium]MCF8073694.1 3-isopropylmalate dehydratase large subunit [Desulfarculaceae bacterium]MCF8101935.1 3-isopropylmalate dehydratase large subunit [Desulfarculaceae bacterium]
MPTLLDKIWDNHLVRRESGRPDLIYIDRHLVHEVTSPQAFAALRRDGRKVRRPDLTYAVCDHVTPTNSTARPLADEIAENQLASLEANTAEFGVPYFGWGKAGNGVIHVTMPEQGLVLPGTTVVAGDSHTATHGALGALAFGIGTSEVEHVLATQTLPQDKPPCLAMRAEGALPAGCGAKDLILYIIGHLGAAGATGFAIEYQGEAVRGLSMEGRMTMCNMSIEAGARSGMVAPDETTFAWLEGRPHAPRGQDWDKAVAYWRTLPSDPDAKFKRTETVDLAGLEPMVTWGTNPGQVAGISQTAPDPAGFQGEAAKAAAEALAYQGLKPGDKLNQVPIDYAFIGSCTNGRLEDLRAAAAVVKGKKVADGVTALVVPGSERVKAEAEAEGLDKVFSEAGFQWRLPGCSMCLAMNPDVLPAGKRCASTSNRNFKDRQGHGGRTHLVGPAMAAASAINGRLSDPREFM